MAMLDDDDAGAAGVDGSAVGAVVVGVTATLDAADDDAESAIFERFSAVSDTSCACAAAADLGVFFLAVG